MGEKMSLHCKWCGIKITSKTLNHKCKRRKNV